MDELSQRNRRLFKEAAREIANFMRNEPHPFGPADRGFWIVKPDEAGDLLTLESVARDDFLWSDHPSDALLRELVDTYDLDRQVVVLIIDQHRPSPGGPAAVLWRPGQGPGHG
jgi:hypothetical protein